MRIGLIFFFNYLGTELPQLLKSRLATDLYIIFISKQTIGGVLQEPGNVCPKFSELNFFNFSLG